MSKKNSPTLAAHKKPGTKKPISITIEPEVLDWLDERGDNRSEGVTRDLTRYYRLLAEARTTLRDKISPAELSAIIDVQNGHWYAKKLHADEIWANVEDGCRLDGLAAKWDIDGPALVEKLKTLDLSCVHALSDATERFWQAVGHGDHQRDPAISLD